jgi:AAA+ superfamily predicted ATPase
MTMAFHVQDELEAGDAQVALWTLRVLEAGALKALVQQGEAFIEEDDARALGLKKRLNLTTEPTRQQLARRRRALERKPQRPDGELTRNVGWLGHALSLDEVERELLMLAVSAQRFSLLRASLGALRFVALHQLHQLLARVLGRPVEAVRRASSPEGQLARTKLLQLQVQRRRRRFGHEFLPEFEVFQLMEGLSGMLLGNHASPEALMQEFFRPAPPPLLQLSDFAYAEEPIALLRAILAGALAGKTPGVNVCVHGASGVGKTQLARLLARELSAALFEVPFQDDDGDPITGAARLGKAVVAGKLLAQRERALILFDEMEDAFAKSPFAFLRDKATDKAWTNHLLEENPVPIVWLSNAIGHVDPAYMRRFHFVLRLEAPPASVRRQMLSRALGGLPLGADWLERVAADDRLAPGILERAAASVRLAGVTEGPAVERAMDQLLTGALATQGPARRGPVQGSRPAPYDLAYVNADRALEPLVEGLARTKRGTVCLYGPPGTGKTAFAQHVAERLGRPLLVRRASDLLGPLLGQTEAAIAEMFERAAREGAVLFLDEADSFLRERSTAVRSWEVSQVNELLVGMEAFDGVFLCATNLFESLDQASLRRFALKVRFDPMTLAQAMRLFAATAAAPCDADWLRGELARLPNLTPGDFATVARQATLLGEPLHPERLVAGLHEEHKHKRGALTRRVGFA